jgi:hypothetical protein
MLFAAMIARLRVYFSSCCRAVSLWAPDVYEGAPPVTAFLFDRLKQKACSVCANFLRPSLAYVPGLGASLGLVAAITFIMVGTGRWQEIKTTLKLSNLNLVILLGLVAGNSCYIGLDLHWSGTLMSTSVWRVISPATAGIITTLMT